VVIDLFRMNFNTPAADVIIIVLVIIIIRTTAIMTVAMIHMIDTEITAKNTTVMTHQSETHHRHFRNIRNILLFDQAAAVTAGATVIDQAAAAAATVIDQAATVIDQSAAATATATASATVIDQAATAAATAAATLVIKIEKLRNQSSLLKDSRPLALKQLVQPSLLKDTQSLPRLLKNTQSSPRKQPKFQRQINPIKFQNHQHH
jgi:hypothetical protein